MKHLPLLFCVLFAYTVSVQAQKKNEKVLSAAKPATVSGVVKSDKFSNKAVKLFKVSDGVTVEIGSAVPSAKGEFGFLFYPEYEGLYVVGTGNEMSANGNYKFYFESGDKLSLEINDWDYNLTGAANSKENIVLTQWFHSTDSVYQKAINFSNGISTYIDFFPHLDATTQKAKNWFKSKATGNAKFDAAMPGIMQMDMALYASNFLQTPRTKHPTLEQLSPYYATLKPEAISQTTVMVYQHPWGIRTLQGVLRLPVRMQAIKDEKDAGKRLQYSLNAVPNDTLKGDIVLGSLAGVRTFENYKQVTDMFGNYLLTDKQKKRDVEIATPLASNKKGEEAYNFSYPDVNGKMVSMKDLKGKVVLVDVWATWCMPCKKEIPHLKKLEEEMKGKDVQIVSISVDVEKDKEKWRHMIDTAKLGGMQLFASGWSDIAKYYKITGIPRFMVFDRNGKIVSVDSPRPSEPELKEMLEKALAEEKVSVKEKPAPQAQKG